MRRKKKAAERFSARQAMGLSFQQTSALLYGRPMLHINCSGSLEVENCRGILAYDEEKLKLNMGDLCVQIEGDGLMIDTYSKKLITIHGRIFAIKFFYEGVS